MLTLRASRVRSVLAPLVLGIAWLAPAIAAPVVLPSSLLAIDQNRTAMVDAILRNWHDALVQQFGADFLARETELRDALLALRADRLLAASLAGSTQGLALAFAEPVAEWPPALQAKALGDPITDVTYVPVTPCRLVETRSTFNGVYHAAGPFAPNQIRTYTVHGGNGVCLTQLPATLHPAAIQMQIFGLPTTSTSGDIEVLPQGSTFGSTATLVYIGSIPFNTASTVTRVNPANDQISVQVRGGGAHLAIDVVGYFEAPAGNGGQFFRQGGNAFGAAAQLGTIDNQPLDLRVNNARALRLLPGTIAPNVLGGYQNNGTYTVDGATIGGGGAPGGNDIFDHPSCVLQFGCINAVIDSWGTVAGGVGNIAGAGTSGIDGTFAAVGGGINNWAYKVASVVAGGFDNTASGASSAILGGGSNTASGSASAVLGGELNVASGDYSAVLAGEENKAIGQGSMAAGGGSSRASRDGEFVWTDNEGNIYGFDPGSYANGWANATNTFNVRATGGVWLVTSVGTTGVPTTYCSIGPGGGVWSCTSSRDVKADFEDADARDVLRKVVAMPITTWRYKTEPAAIRHIGPMAQDFNAAFRLGHDPLGITTSDAAGVALAAIQALHQLIEERDAQVDRLERVIEQMRRTRAAAVP